MLLEKKHTDRIWELWSFPRSKLEPVSVASIVHKILWKFLSLDCENLEIQLSRVLISWWQVWAIKQILRCSSDILLSLSLLQSPSTPLAEDLQCQKCICLHKHPASFWVPWGCVIRSSNESGQAESAAVLELVHWSNAGSFVRHRDKKVHSHGCVRSWGSCINRSEEIW